MRTPLPNWNLRCIPVTFPYVCLLFAGGPPPVPASRSPMPRERRAKLFAPFDALEGFSESISGRNTEFVSALEQKDAPARSIDTETDDPV